MENKQEISKGAYLFMCLFCLIAGLVIVGIFSTFFIMGWETMYSAFYWAMGMLITGFGMGLSVARAFKIRGIDK